MTIFKIVITPQPSHQLKRIIYHFKAEKQ